MCGKSTRKRGENKKENSSRYFIYVININLPSTQRIHYIFSWKRHGNCCWKFSNNKVAHDMHAAMLCLVFGFGCGMFSGRVMSAWEIFYLSGMCVHVYGYACLQPPGKSIGFEWMILTLIVSHALIYDCWNKSSIMHISNYHNLCGLMILNFMRKILVFILLCAKRTRASNAWCGTLKNKSIIGILTT